jgi:hypothetical protein
MRREPQLGLFGTLVDILLRASPSPTHHSIMNRINLESPEIESA